VHSTPTFSQLWIGTKNELANIEIVALSKGKPVNPIAVVLPWRHESVSVNPRFVASVLAFLLQNR
jgi:hypothetical protein